MYNGISAHPCADHRVNLVWRNFRQPVAEIKPDFLLHAGHAGILPRFFQRLGAQICRNHLRCNLLLQQIDRQIAVIGSHIGNGSAGPHHRCAAGQTR